MNAAEIAAQAPRLKAYLADLRKQSRAIRAARRRTLAQYRLTKAVGKG